MRIDTVEQALRDVCLITDIEGKGYRLSYKIVSDNLRLGISVVADSCNPIELTRREWENVATDAGAHYINIEIICADSNEHRRRVETRNSSVPNLKLPTWKDVEQREYHDWTVNRIIVDTATKSEADCVRDLLHQLSQT